MTRRALLLTQIAILSLMIAGCDADPEQGGAHEHPAHLHGPNHGDLAQLTDGVWLEVAIFHDQATMVLWTHAGPHAGDLKPSKMPHQPTLSFSFEGSDALIEGVPFSEAGDNAFKFVHGALGWDIPGAKLSMQIDTTTHTVDVPAHHH